MSDLLRWFLAAWADEMPSAIHGRGVWRDHVRLGEPSVGGSLLGTPADGSGFRNYLYTPHKTDKLPGEDDGAYLQPIRESLRALSGYRPNGTGVRPFMAAFLFTLGCNGGNLELAGLKHKIPDEVVPVYAEQALWRLRQEYNRLPKMDAVA